MTTFARRKMMMKIFRSFIRPVEKCQKPKNGNFVCFFLMQIVQDVYGKEDLVNWWWITRRVSSFTRLERGELEREMPRVLDRHRRHCGEDRSTN